MHIVQTNQTEEDLDRCLQENHEMVAHLLQSLMEKSFNLYRQQTIAFNIRQELHPEFKRHYEAGRTPADGNCLWHAISLCMMGNTSLMAPLRLATQAVLRQQERQFQQMLAADQTVGSTHCSSLQGC